VINDGLSVRLGTQCTVPSIFIVGRDRAKLGYFWRPAYHVPQRGLCQGIPVNADTGEPVYRGDERLLASDLARVRHSEVIGGIKTTEAAGKARRLLFSPLWQADQTKIRRCAPIDFIGRYLQGFFDYGIADEVHELKGDTAQGNALGTLAACAKRVAVLTGTLLGGYADDLFNILFRLEPHSIVSEGFEWGESGVRRFMESYGVLEKVAIIQPEENACSKARVTRQVRRRPGASPLLFGRFLMSLGAFVSLEDISEALPPYEEEVIGVPMDSALAEAYAELEEAIKQALKEHRGNRSVLSIALNTLLLYPDRPFGLGSLTGFDYDPVTRRRESFVIAETRDLATNCQYAKERRLLEEVKAELAQGRRCQIYVVYTQKRDVTERLESILHREGIRVAVLSSKVPPEQRESWYERQVRQGIEVVICHPKLVQTGLDLIQFPTLIFYETGYSIFVLRQASRRSWRIGQKEPVKVKFLYYEDTVQASCLRLMGKKLLVSLAMEGKFANEGLQAIDGDDDLLMAMARELVQERGIGESADAIWKNLRKQQEEVFSIRSEFDSKEGSHSSGVLETEIGDSDRSFATELSAWNPMHQLALFGQCRVLSEATKSRRVIRKTSCPQSTQQSLFETV
jgi:Helicase conserved C-terminal domain